MFHARKHYTWIYTYRYTAEPGSLVSPCVTHIPNFNYWFHADPSNLFRIWYIYEGLCHVVDLCTLNATPTVDKMQIESRNLAKY